MLRGLAHIHLHGVVHRDLVMPNLMLSHGGEDDAVQIGDFGLASSAASFVLERNVTQLAGRSPEVLLSAEAGSATLRAPAYTMDLWGAGVASFSLYFARLPFTARSDDVDGVTECLQSMCDLLGSPEVSWPDVTKHRLWSKFCPNLRPVVGKEPRVALSSPEFTKRELPKDHHAIDLVSSLLRWDPNQRAEAALAASRVAGVSAATPRVAGVSAATPPLEAAGVGTAAEEGDQPAAPDGLCKCGGGCCTKGCNFKKVRVHRSGAIRYLCLKPAPDSVYCDDCKCRVAECPKMKTVRC